MSSRPATLHRFIQIYINDDSNPIWRIIILYYYITKWKALQWQMCLKNGVSRTTEYRLTIKVIVYSNCQIYTTVYPITVRFLQLFWKTTNDIIIIIQLTKKDKIVHIVRSKHFFMLKNSIHCNWIILSTYLSISYILVNQFLAHQFPGLNKRDWYLQYL